MSKGKRLADIDALLKRSKADIAKIVPEYERSLHLKEILPELRIDVKNLMGNLRSILDYLAHDIREIYCPTLNPADKFYFPICVSLADFRGTMNRSYTGLEQSDKNVWELLEAVQPYNLGYEWLRDLNRLNNEGKHDLLTPQERREMGREVRAEHSSGGAVAWTGGVSFSGNVSVFGVPIDPRSQLPVPDPSLKVSVITWVDFHFGGTEISAQRLLRDATHGMARVVASVRHVL